MRTLIFVPPNYGHNSGVNFRHEIMSRLTTKASPLTEKIQPVDLVEEYGADGWEDLFSVLSTYQGEFDCLVVAIDGIKADRNEIELRSRMESIANLTNGMPIVAYVDEMRSQTMLNLMAQDFSLVVDSSQDVRTLNAVVMRSIALRNNSGRVLQIGPVGIDLSTGDIKVDERPLHLTHSETKLLSLLARRKGQVVTRDQLLAMSYQGVAADDIPEMKILDVFVCKIRRKFNEANPSYPQLGTIIETAWGRGYRVTDYDPASLQFAYGPLVLRYDAEKKLYHSLDNQHVYDDTDVALLDFFRNAGNSPVSLSRIGQYLSETDYGRFTPPELEEKLASLASRTPLEPDRSEVMLSRQSDGSWIFLNPHYGNGTAAERRRAEILVHAAKEEVTGITFLRHSDSVFVEAGLDLLQLTKKQLELIKFFDKHRGVGFSTRDTAKTIMRLNGKQLTNYMTIVAASITRVNEKLGVFPTYTPIQFANGGHMIGMAQSASDLVPYDSWSAPNGPVRGMSGGLGNEGIENTIDREFDDHDSFEDGPPSFVPVPRGVGRGSKSFFRDIDLFDTNAPQTEIQMRGVTLRVNNKTRTSFVPTGNVAFTPIETLALLKIWYSRGSAVPASDIGNKSADAAAIIQAITRKMGAHATWTGRILEVEGQGYALAPNPRPQASGPADVMAGITTATVPKELPSVFNPDRQFV